MFGRAAMQASRASGAPATSSRRSRGCLSGRSPEAKPWHHERESAPTRYRRRSGAGVLGAGQSEQSSWDRLRPASACRQPPPRTPAELQPRGNFIPCGYTSWLPDAANSRTERVIPQLVRASGLLCQKGQRARALWGLNRRSGQHRSRPARCTKQDDSSSSFCLRLWLLMSPLASVVIVTEDLVRRRRHIYRAQFRRRPRRPVVRIPRGVSVLARSRQVATPRSGSNRN